MCGKVLFLLGSQEAKKREEKRERSILLLPGNVNIMNSWTGGGGKRGLPGRSVAGKGSHSVGGGVVSLIG